MRKLLVLCEGNICRSPMAAGLLASSLPECRVQSAGLGAMVGSPAHEIAVELMADRGIDISAHRAQQVNRSLCLEADLILVMEQMQRERLEHLYPPVRGRVFRTNEFQRLDVPDPYRQPREAFAHSLSLLQRGIQSWVLRINKL